MNTFRSLAGASLILALAGCGGSTATTPPASGPSAPSATAPASAGSGAPAGAIDITERDFRFDTPEVAAKAGAVSLAVTNAGPTVHDLTIRDSSGMVLGATDDLKPGASGTVTVRLAAGTYTIFCALPGHESLGLKGTLTVAP